MTAERTHLEFLESFNQDLMRLGCDARVAAVPGCSSDMQVVDPDGTAIGRIPTRIDPDVFCAFMLIVEKYAV